MDRQVKKCAECGSEYYMNSSEMVELCPECSHQLYGYDNCQHEFENGRCVKCYWKGTKSEFIKNSSETYIDPLIKDLYDSIPEFNIMVDHSDDELIYVVFGELSIRLYEDIINNSSVTEFTKKCFQFFNKMGNKNDDQIDNLLVVGIYEGLYADKKCNGIARKLLVGRNKEVYEYWMKNGNIRADF